MANNQRGIKLLVHPKGSLADDPRRPSFTFFVGPKTTLNSFRDRVRSRFRLEPSDTLVITNGGCDWEDEELWDQVRRAGNLTDPADGPDGQDCSVRTGTSPTTPWPSQLRSWRRYKKRRS
jgi:hypothetical protein